MKKRRRLANKMTIMVCAVLIAVSAFFYIPMEAHAAVNTFTDTVSVTETTVERMMFNMRSTDNAMSFPAVTKLTAGKYYEIKYSGKLGLKLDKSFNVNTQNLYMHFGGLSFSLFERENSTGFDANVRKEYSFSGSFVYKAVSNPKFDYNFIMTISKNSSTTYNVTATHDFTFNIDSITEVVTSNAQDYQNGYNAGYSAGEDAGYDSGYSSGYNAGYNKGYDSGYDEGQNDSSAYDEGYQDGANSVDTQAYYDSGYDAGYKAAYSIGFDEGYDEAYDIAFDAGYDSAMAKVEQWGADTNTYPMYVTGKTTSKVSKMIFVDWHEARDLDFVQKEFDWYDVNPNHTYKFLVSLSPLSFSYNHDLDFVSLFGYYTYFEVGGHRYVIPSGSQNVEIYIPGDMMTTSYAYGVVLQGISTIVDGAGEYTINLGVLDVELFDMGPSGETQNHIANQTDKLNENADKNTDKVLNSWDSSHGNSVNDNLSSGLNDYQTAEDSLWATATSGLQDFTFFDFQSVPAMITGLSFVSSIMSTWFYKAGGASGVGIVLSVLFSVMLVSMVLGLYRMYQSAGHRASVQKRRESKKKGK